MQKIKFGILGTSEIAPRSLIAPVKNFANAEVYGIASRAMDKAKGYAEAHQIPHVFSNYDALIACPEIDAVYIPLINSIHAEWVVRAADAKKHILVEKPICINTKDFYSIESAAKRNDVQILEGMMIQYSAWQKRLKEIIDNKIYGNLKAIKTRANYKLVPTDTYRIYPEKGGGVFYEEGLLWCEITQLCCGLDPIQFSGKSDFAGPNGIDATFEAKVIFADGVISELLCSYELPYAANHWLEFEEAQIKIRNFWKPCFGHLQINFDVTHTKTGKREKIFFEPENYYTNQIKYFLDVIEGKKNNIPLTLSRDRIILMEKIYCYAKENILASNLE